MKILVTGHEGKIGSLLVKRGAEPLDCDVSTLLSVQEAMLPYQGEEYTIINCAVKKDVDWCEKRENHIEAHAVNVLGVSNLLNTMNDKSKFIQVSSCHVYNGRKYWPYSEKHAAHPVNQYGWTKLIAESHVSVFSKPALVVRLGTVYDAIDLEGIVYTPDDATVPKFLKRNFIRLSDVGRLLMTLPDMIGKVDFPGKFYPLLNLGNPEQNYSYDLWYMLVRDKFGKPELKKRSLDDKNYAPRPYRCALNVDAMRKLFPEYQFRNL